MNKKHKIVDDKRVRTLVTLEYRNGITAEVRIAGAIPRLIGEGTFWSNCR